MNEDVFPVGNGDFQLVLLVFRGVLQMNPQNQCQHPPILGQAQEGTAQEVWEAQQQWQKGVWMSIVEGFLTKHLLYLSQDITMKISY